jgi:hypothetical protein
MPFEFIGPDQGGPDIPIGGFTPIGAGPNNFDTPIAGLSPPPDGVRVRFLGNSTIEVRWLDVLFQYSENHPVDTWGVRFTSDAAAGVQVGGLTWAKNVFAAGFEIGRVSSQADGGERKITYTNSALTTGYITICGQNRGILGIPCTPVPVSFATALTVLPPEVTLQTMIVNETVALNGTGGYVLITGMLPSYIPPATLTNFRGMQLHMKGFNGTTELTEVGTMHLYDGAPTGNSSYVFSIPFEDLPLGSGTATFTNGSKNVVRVSGTNFAIGWQNRIMTVNYGTTPPTFEPGPPKVQTFTDVNHLSLFVNFAGTTGTYTFQTYNLWDFYFVSVSKSGVRRPDVVASSPHIAV